MFRVFECVIYSLISFWPYMMIAMYPFWGAFRYSKKVTVSFVVILTILQIVSGVWHILGKGEVAAVLSLINTITYALFYFSAFRIHFGKLLFTLLIVSNLANLVVMCAKCLEGILFPSLAMQGYRWSFAVTTIVVQVIVLWPFVMYTKHFYRGAIQKNYKQINWNYLWLIPATFYLAWYYHIYFGGQNSLDAALQIDNSLYALAINFGAILVIHVVIKMIDQCGKNMELEANNHFLALKVAKYDNLQERMLETRRARHDMRHHMVALLGYLEQEDYGSVKSYLQEYLDRTLEGQLKFFCGQKTINTLLQCFEELAKDHEIDFRVKIALPDELPIKDQDITVLFGNLIENAIEACKSLPKEERKIQINCQYQQRRMFLIVDNTFYKPIKKDSNGEFVSTKHEGNGIGVESVKTIVKRYNGAVNFEQENNMFCVSVMLCLEV